MCCVCLLQKQLDTLIKVPTWQTQNSDDKKNYNHYFFFDIKKCIVVSEIKILIIMYKTFISLLIKT